MKYILYPQNRCENNRTELMTARQSVLHVHTTYFVKKRAPLAEFVMYKISWVQTMDLEYMDTQNRRLYLSIIYKI